jgi:rod shape-determining protein MreD
MIDPVAARLWAYRGLFCLVVVILLFLRILPIGDADGGLPGPDLLLCLILAWVIRRPDHLPALLIAVAVLIEDLVLMRPPGLWAAAMVLATEFLRARTALTRELVFVIEWLMVTGLMLAMMLGLRLVMALAFVDQPGFAFAFAQIGASALVYPLVVGALHLVLDIRKPSTGEVDAFGRRL